ncbi:hypothetical protein CVT26_005036 [Gymnopilus dilepis]|uniref:Uncharacterized protein n=1 Tax=Gymnopilus dilepis TaxID=231916 RepID=A0A409Y023_9AGAR|nr:hypothetical protein CVT26_005036 [Gymnopilus dilepis]
MKIYERKAIRERTSDDDDDDKENFVGEQMTSNIGFRIPASPPVPFPLGTIVNLLTLLQLYHLFVDWFLEESA